jgi:glycosyltransferase involved in cell wall biosynthesis
MSQEGWKVVIITKIPDVNFSHNTKLLNELESGVEINYILRKNILYPGMKKDFNSFFQKNKKKLIHDKKQLFIKRLIGFVKEKLARFAIPDLDIFIVPFMIKKTLPFLKEGGKKVIVTTSPEHSLHLAGFVCKKLTKTPWIADFRDPWDHYPITGSIYLNNSLERKLKKMVVESADTIISTTDRYNLNLINEFSYLDRNKFYKITNCYSDERARRTTKKTRDKFIISYTGIFYPNKDPFTFFRALRTWFDGLENGERTKYERTLTVQLIGARTKVVEQVIKDLDLWTVVKFINRVPHEEALEMSIASDLLLICAGLGKQTRPGWIPSKLLEYLGCQVPLLAICREGEMAEIIRKTESGYVITEENHDMICNILRYEIDKKLAGQTHLDFKFKNIEQFEEKNTMGQFVKIIEKISLSRQAEV